MNDIIKTHSITDTRKDWLLVIEISSPVKIKVTLIPDKLTADHSSVTRYLNDMANKDWENPEKMILQIIEDINNALVPKWLEVAYEKDGIILKVEDRQPGLENLNFP